MVEDLLTWTDGNYLHSESCLVPIAIHSLQYGSAIFEGIRSYDGKPFLLQEHVQRFFQSASYMRMKIVYSPEEISYVCETIAKSSRCPDLYLRPIAWFGSRARGLLPQAADTHVAILSNNWPVSARMRKKGLRLTTATYRRSPPMCGPLLAKASGLYCATTISRLEAEERGFDDALILDWRGFLAEATGANIFFVREGKLHTPAVNSCLSGLTRKTVIQIGRKLGYDVLERDILPDEIATFEECFLTGTAVELAGVECVDGVHFSVTSATSEITRSFHRIVGHNATDTEL
jgi:branched-chain amino acid aminotransferase